MKCAKSIEPAVVVASAVNCEYQATVSYSQRHVHFLDALSDERQYCVAAMNFRLYGQLNEQAFAKAVAVLCQRFDILRTVYHCQQGQLHQYIQPYQHHKLPFRVAAVSACQMLETVKSEAEQGFDLAVEWPIRVSLFTSELEQVLCLTFHQIAADQHSIKLLIGALSEAYRLFCHDIAADDSLLNSQVFSAPQYQEYGLWQQQYLASDSCQQAQQYWVGLLKDAPSVHRFPLEFSRQLMPSLKSDALEHRISGQLLSKLKQLSERKQLSVFLLLQSLFAGFIARCQEQSSGETDFVIGSVYANRLPERFANTIGSFANTIPFRYLVDGEANIDFLIDCTKAQHKQALGYQQLPFAIMLERAKVVRDSSYNPLIQIEFVCHLADSNDLALYALDTELFNSTQPLSKLDFALHIYIYQQEIKIRWQYHTQLFSRGRINEMLFNFVDFIECYLANENNKVLCYSFDQRHRLLDRNQQAHGKDGVTKAHFAPYVSCVERIEHYATLRPEAIAVSHGGYKLKYIELINHANHIIAGMQQSGIKAGDKVAVYIDKSIEQIIVMYAVMRAGCVYVPIAPSAAVQQAAYICQNTGVRALICNNNEQPDEYTCADIELLLYESLLSCVRLPVLTKIEPNSPAYVIFTSGDNKPAGVVVSHGSIYYALHVNRQVFEFQSLDKMPTISCVATGIFLLETLVPLISGGTVQVLTTDDSLDVATLIANSQKVTVMHMVPSLLVPWLDLVACDKSLYPQLRLLLVGGDVVPATLLQRVKAWRGDVMVRVLYGLTETCMVSSSYLSHEHHINKYCIGKPHPQVDFYVMNRFGQLQTQGMVGELYIGGLSLASGYIDLSKPSDELLSDGFIFHQQLQQRLYKTGDRVRLLASGHYEFLGRVEQQLNYRGVHCEASYIECLAYQVDGVKQCIATVTTADNGSEQLVLYYARQLDAPDKQVLEHRITTRLAQQLCESMRPSVLVELDFCYGSNGKIERTKFPQLNIEISYVAPATDTERYLQQLWCKELVLSKISVTVNFFELGGDSLLLSQLHQQINDHFGIILPLKLLFIATNIRDCARLIDEKVSFRKLRRLLT